MIFPQMIYMCQDMQDTMQEKCATDVAHRTILRGTVNEHFHVMIVKIHIKRDQHYVNTAHTTGQRACRLIEEEVIP